jgi:parvulin-like peptidyl-prolyl isomerase
VAQNKLAIAIGLGAALILLVIGFAIFRGLGQPGVPDGDIAIVQTADPEGVTTAEFDKAFELLLVRQDTVDNPPAEGTDAYEQTKDAAVNDVLLERWLLGEAEEQGYEISDRLVDQRLDEIKEQSFVNEREFDRFVEQSGFDDEEVLRRVRLQVINERMQEDLIADIPFVSDAQIEAFFEQNEDQFSRPASRQVRLILNEDEAVVADARTQIEADNRGRTWRRLADEVSEDETSRNRGGRLDGVVEGRGDPDFDRTVFEAQEGELIGPFETDRGFYLIEVFGSTPEDNTPFEEVSENIRQQIAGARQQQDAALSQNLFLQKWATRTICAEDFVTSQCRNAPPFPKPPGAPPVISSPPVLPGTAGRVGAPLPPLPQGPYPAVLPEGPQGIAPGLPGLSQP